MIFIKKPESAFIFKDIFKLILLLVIDGILTNLCRKYYIFICNEKKYHISLLLRGHYIAHFQQ